MFIFLLACSRAPIEDGWRHGAVLQVKDLFTSSFLITHEAGIALVDAGYDADAQPILKAIESEGKEAEDVLQIFVTHGHSDHLNGLSAFPNAEVYALEAEQELLEEEGGRLDVVLSDGEQLLLGGVEVEVFSVPGHTKGNAVYRVDDMLIMGDSAQSYKDGTMTPVAEKYADDPDLAATSLIELGKRLAERTSSFSYTLFSHSGALEGIDALLSYEIEP